MFSDTGEIRFPAVSSLYASLGLHHKNDSPTSFARRIVLTDTFSDQFPSVNSSAAAPMWMRYSVFNETYGSPEYVFIENSE